MHAVAKLLDTIEGSYDERLGVIAEIIDATNNSVSICQPKGLELPIIYANKGFLDLCGYAFEEVLGSHCLFLQQDDIDQAETAQLLAAIRNGKHAKATLRNYRKDGTRFYNELYATPIHDDEGRARYVVVVQNDVTALHASEAELNEAIQVTLRDSATLTKRILSRIDALGTAPVRSALQSFNAEEEQLLARLSTPPDKTALAADLGWSEAGLEHTLTYLQNSLGVKDLGAVQAWALKNYKNVQENAQGFGKN